MAQTVVLLAEDEPDVRQFVAFALQQEDFIVLPACDAGQALEIFHNHGNVDVVLTDVQLGVGMNGVDLAEHILQEKPTAKALLISGFPESEILAAERGLPLLSKPFLPNALVDRIRGLLDLKIPAQSETTPRPRRMRG
jgi:DNA-binding response OmpR family regulator